MKKLTITITLLASTLLLGCADDSTDDVACIPDTSLEVESSSVTELGTEHHAAYTDIVIDAPVEQVWATLTDWDNMSNWSSSFQGLSGDIRDGGMVTAAYLNQGQVLEVPHTLIYQEGVRFGWSDPTGTQDMEPFGGFVDNHIFEVQEISACQSRFVQSDAFEGPGNASFDSEGLANFIVSYYQAFNTELKAEIEQ